MLFAYPCAPDVKLANSQGIEIWAMGNEQNKKKNEQKTLPDNFQGNER